MVRPGVDDDNDCRACNLLLTIFVVVRTIAVVVVWDLAQTSLAQNNNSKTKALVPKL